MRRLDLTIGAVALTLCAATTSALACAPTCQNAYEHYSKGEYKDSVALLNALVAVEDPCAQYWLGESYRLGRGVEKSAAKAKRLYELSARKGFEQAKARLLELKAKGA